MTIITGEWLGHAGTQTVFSMLTNAGFKALAVGGCVRNALMNLPVSDVDFATDATPDQVEICAADLGLKSIPTGKEHGTITVLSSGQSFEITTFRKDVHSDGRHAKVEFSRSVLQDAQRRDFTMNALYCDHTGEIFDPLDGLPDLRNRRVKFIGDPNARITEDYLRILRFFRFNALYSTADIGLDPDGLAACALHADGLNQLSKERVGAEIRKLLTAKNPAPAAAAMGHSGILMRILPGASGAVLPVLVHFEDATKTAPDWGRRLASLGGENVSANLKLSKVESRRLNLLTASTGEGIALEELAYRHGAKAAKDIILLRAAAFGTEPILDFQNAAEVAAKMVFPVSAADLMPKLQGPALGARLNQLEATWIASGFRATKTELLG